ncbi:MAG: hypothetical protein HY220_02110 [Candidatus Sungbacteria bacterium]|uniref:Glycine-zipper-containing OmpA-like membrane domain-containing protein n=1 Tax=Candidatus Sungiibacteriota bacterium TaxID=2750080 RepID=A0A9D6LPT8_9BACT|nr:hypothetical protein [Candidatus Sungbacteria bacterium]
MKVLFVILVMLAMVAGSVPAAGQPTLPLFNPYPGVTQEKMDTDTKYCLNFATVQVTTQVPGQDNTGRDAAVGALGGAATGAAIGAIAGGGKGAGKGAAIGGLAGLIFGGLSGASQAQSSQTQTTPMLDGNRYAACMNQLGYPRVP